MDFQNFCQTVFISLIIIFLCHYFFYYLQASFTEPKVKDMINRPNEKYDSIMKVVNSENENKDSHEKSDHSDMKNELSNYINEISPNNLTEINNNLPNSEQGLPLPSNNFENEELTYSAENSTTLPDSTPIDQLSATQ